MRLYILFSAEQRTVLVSSYVIDHKVGGMRIGCQRLARPACPRDAVGAAVQQYGGCRYYTMDHVKTQENRGRERKDPYIRIDNRS